MKKSTILIMMGVLLAVIFFARKKVKANTSVNTSTNTSVASGDIHARQTGSGIIAEGKTDTSPTLMA